MKKNNLIIYFFSIFAISNIIIGCQESIDRVNDPVPYEKVGGYDNSDQISPSNLLVKLSFEQNVNDAKSGLLSPAPKNAAYETGKKGFCWNGSDSEQRYVVYNTSSTLSSLNAFTYAFWMKSDNTVDPATPGQGKGAQGIFCFVDPAGFWGKVDMFLENPDSANPNRIRLKLHYYNGRAGVVWRDQWPMINIDGQKGNWMHIALTYNPTNGLFQAYLNGNLAASVSGPYSPSVGFIGGYTWYANDPGSASNSNNAPVYGNIDLGSPTKVVLGSMQFETNPSLNGGGQQDWATDFAGKLDEFRIYNTALSAVDVKSLFLLEKDNR